MALLKIKLDNTTVSTSYMGGRQNVSSLDDAWISILKSIYLGGDTIEIVDERVDIPKSFGKLSVSFDTDTACRVYPDKENYGIEDIIEWLEENPVEKKKIIEKMKKA